jgi:lipopolysaccharide/colanic/teichoic acid biosynthesis glycosyltransferase
VDRDGDQQHRHQEENEQQRGHDDVGGTSQPVGGVTFDGLWQVSGRSTLGTLDMLRLDVRYVENRSLRSDADILLRTVFALLRSNGAR